MKTHIFNAPERAEVPNAESRCDYGIYRIRLRPTGSGLTDIVGFRNGSKSIVYMTDNQCKILSNGLMDLFSIKLYYDRIL